jgi:hypothetical protein
MSPWAILTLKERKFKKKKEDLEIRESLEEIGIIKNQRD